MNLKNYYYYFKSALTPRFCQEIIDYGKRHKPEMAVTGGVNIGDKNHKADLLSWLKIYYYFYNFR